MQVDVGMGSVIRTTRSVGGGAGSSVTFGAQEAPHMVAHGDEGQCACYRSAAWPPVVTAGTAARLGCERGTLSRLLNDKAGVWANMALALEEIGWGTVEHRMRMQASYELAQARRDRVAAERRAGALHA